MDLEQEPSVYRLCAACLNKHLESMMAFSKANPNASADDWAKFFDKNQEWQQRQIESHCYRVAA